MVWNKIERITNFFEVHFVIIYHHVLWNPDSLNSFIVFMSIVSSPIADEF